MTPNETNKAIAEKALAANLLTRYEREFIKALRFIPRERINRLNSKQADLLNEIAHKYANRVINL